MTSRAATIATTVLALPLVLAGGACVAPTASVQARAADFSLEGDAGASSSGTVVTTDTEELGLGDDEVAFVPRADLAWGPTTLTVDYLAVNFSGTGTVEGQFDIGGTTIVAGDSVDSEFDLSMPSAFLSFDFVPGSNIDVAPGIGVTWVDFEASVTSNTTGERAATEESAPVPVLGLRAKAGLGALELSGLVRGMSLSSGDVDATLIDLDLGASWNFWGPASLCGGWREVAIDADYEDGSSDVELDLQLRGPWLGLAISI